MAGEDSSRLDLSIEKMRAYYPAFALEVTQTETGRRATWRGKVQPLRTTDRLEDLLDDIHHERPFYILPGGEVLHHPSCATTHEQHDWSAGLTNPHAVYELEVSYGGGKKHPKTYLIDPILPENKRKHMFGDGSICPYAPWQPIWRWDEHTIVDYMPHALGWLIKWTVWDQIGVWIRPEISHEPEFLLRMIGPNKPCWCGSGTKYKKCHRLTDENRERKRQ